MLATAERTTDVVAGWKLDEQELGFYRREGYLYLPGLISRQVAEAAREEVLEIMRAGMELSGAQMTGKDGQPARLVQTTQYLRGSTLDHLINSGHLASIAGRLMGGEACVYMPFTAVKSGGGGGTFSFHQDNQYTRFVDGLQGINIWFALARMSPENGCLQMCPRSHLRGTLEAELDEHGHRRNKVTPADFLPVRMEPGDAIAFSRLTLHGSGANHTPDPRVAYAIQFHRADALAEWDHQPPRLLKGSNRWQTGPVDKITPPNPKGQDGH